MADAAAVAPGDTVLEIGPGPGILTEILLARGAKVVAVELDMKLCDLLRRRFPSPNFDLRQGDALDAAAPSPPFKLVANLPYETFLRNYCSSHTGGIIHGRRWRGRRFAP